VQQEDPAYVKEQVIMLPFYELGNWYATGLEK
jgi:hypothetical protein